MTRHLKRIAPLQAGKVFAILYGLMGLIFVPLFALAAMFGAFAQPAQPGQVPSGAILGGMLLGIGILLPIFYAVMGFVLGLIGSALYNLIARFVGGLEFEIE